MTPQPEPPSADALIERLEWHDERDPDAGLPSPLARAGAITRRTALAGGAAGLAATMLAACGSGSSSADPDTTVTDAVYPTGGHPRFVFVNHVTTNPFMVWVRHGAQDACRLLGAAYQWTGSATSNVPEMLSAFNTALTGSADGIAVALTDPTAFNAPVETALKAKIPVVAYNADAPDNRRLSYIGQDLYLSGQQMAKRAIDLVGSGDIALFVATPGSSDLQPRVDGAKSVFDDASSVEVDTIRTGPDLAGQLSTIDAYVAGHPDVKGLFSVDGGSTQGLAQVIQKRGLRDQGVKGGGYDLNPFTRKLLASDQIDFAIDQQPYLQGFLPILQLFQYRVSGQVTGIADVNTGLKFVEPTTVAPYNDRANSRYG